jgi:hypothetical protein
MSEEARQSLLGRNSYYLLPHRTAKLPPQAVVELEKLGDELLPLTVITWTKPCFTNLDVDSISERFSSEDDVWCRAFLSGEQS